MYCIPTLALLVTYKIAAGDTLNGATQSTQQIVGTATIAAALSPASRGVTNVGVVQVCTDTSKTTDGVCSCISTLNPRDTARLSII